MSNEELNTMIMKAEDNYEALKDRVHEQFEEIKRLKEELKQAKEIALNEYKYASEIEDKYITANNIINELEKSKEKQINDYEILILKIERYLNCYQYFLETQEENNKKIANMIHEFETKDSDKE